MSRRSLLALVALLAVVAFAAWRLRGGPPPEEGAVRGADAPAGERGPEPAPPSVRAPAPAAAPAPGAGLPDAAQRAAALPPGAPGVLEVHTRSGVDGGPVPGVVVHALTPETVRSEAFRQAAMGARDRFDGAWLGDFGAARTTDAQGRAFLPYSGGELAVLVLGERWAGQVEIESAPDGPLEVPLIALSDFTVRVVDSRGRPAEGVLVVLSLERGERMAPWEGRRTGPEGLVRLPQAGELRRRLPEGQRELYAGLAIVSAEPLWHPVPARPPDGPLQLALPPTGEVVVRVEGAGGEQGTASLRARIPGEDEHQARWRTMDAPREALVDGRARFPWVALGLELVAEVDLASTGGELRGEASGPLAAGQAVELRVSLAGEPTLGGRLIGKDGEPLADARVESELKSESMSYGSSLQTDGAGRFRIVLSDEMQRGPLESIALRLEQRRGFVDEVLAEVVVELPPELRGPRELGDLRLVDPPLFVAGRVVDAGGRPVEGARVACAALLHRDERSGEEHWNADHRLNAVAGADGAFAVRGRPGWDDDVLGWRVDAGSPEHTSRGPVGFEPGQAALTLVLESAGSLVASWSLPEGVRARDVTARLEGPDPDRELGGTGRGGEVRWSALAPGVYRLLLGLEGVRQPLVTVDGLRVVAGEECRDPRAQGIDLGPLVRTIEVAVVDEAGEPIDGDVTVWGMLRRDGGYSGSGVGEQRDARTWVVARPAGGAVDLKVEAEGFCEVDLGEVSESLEVRLARRAEVLLELSHPDAPGIERARAAGMVPVRFRPDRGAGTPSRAEVELVPAGGPGRYRARFCADGRYSVSWQLVTPSERAGRVALNSVDGGWIELSRAQQGTVLRLEVPAALRE